MTDIYMQALQNTLSDAKIKRGKPAATKELAPRVAHNAKTMKDFHKGVLQEQSRGRNLIIGGNSK